MSYLTEAFKALDALNEETFSVSDDGIKKLAEFETDDDLFDEITVFDADADDTEDLEDSYVGKVIVDCNVCHSKIYQQKNCQTFYSVHHYISHTNKPVFCLCL